MTRPALTTAATLALMPMLPDAIAHGSPARILAALAVVGGAAAMTARDWRAVVSRKTGV